MTDGSWSRRLLHRALRRTGLQTHLRAARAAGTVPRLVGRMALRARTEPTPEAVAAAGADGDGPLADRLATHVRQARGRGESGLESFAAATADDHPHLARAVRQVGAATGAPAGERRRRLERATETAMQGVEDRSAAAASALDGPVTAVYAFGVLLPLALVGVLPAAATAGVPGGVLLATVVVGYDLLLPGALLGAAGWLLARRPVAFPREPVPASHPARHDGPWRAIAVGAGAGVLAGAVVGLLPPVPGWAAPVAAAGVAGSGLAVHCRPAVTVRERAAAMERALPDALVAVGREVAAGVAVERAIAEAADSLGEPAGGAFEVATERGRRLGCGVETAFLGPGGPVANLPSPRLARAVGTLAQAGRIGPPAGSLLVATGEHLDQLRRLAERTRRETARLTATLANTAAVFGPLVGGTTVALAAGTARRAGGAAGTTLTNRGAPGLGTTLPVADLGLAVGGYVLVLAALLTALATGLRYGMDRARIGYRVGLALPLAATVFCLALVAGSAVV
ncbi:type II secretion system protein [Haloglomus litoreum]|uniref:type II secretion system protein n=1 Tax=Haloglomus litoreum TaxID=3034026 RepID=UPI0023E7A347|nr:type II secretion system protein [Haloglomus sp. DT116]